MPVARLLPLLLACAALAACEASRETPVLSCTGDHQCPADGKHRCNTEKKACEGCDGMCATTPASDTANTEDDTAASTETATAGTASDTTATTGTDTGSADTTPGEATSTDATAPPIDATATAGDAD